MYSVIRSVAIKVVQSLNFHAKNIQLTGFCIFRQERNTSKNCELWPVIWLHFFPLSLLTWICKIVSIVFCTLSFLCRKSYCNENGLLSTKNSAQRYRGQYRLFYWCPQIHQRSSGCQQCRGFVASDGILASRRRISILESVSYFGQQTEQWKSLADILLASLDYGWYHGANQHWVGPSAKRICIEILAWYAKCWASRVFIGSFDIHLGSVQNEQNFNQQVCLALMNLLNLLVLTSENNKVVVNLVPDVT